MTKMLECRTFTHKMREYSRTIPHFRHAQSMVVYLKSLNRTQYSNMLRQVGRSIMNIIATADHRGLYNAVCEDSADWAGSAWALTITKQAEISTA